VSTPRGEGWNDGQLAVLVGVTPAAFARWRAGLRYPEVRMLKKIEAIFGWPAAEQIELIPMSGHDLTWSMKFTQILNEWKAANPRTVPVKELRSLYSTRFPV
jgi:transcriptional regulator with XRE-family HTH domain